MSNNYSEKQRYTPSMVGEWWDWLVYCIHMITITTTFRLGHGIVLQQVVRGVGWRY